MVMGGGMSAGRDVGGVVCGGLKMLKKPLALVLFMHVFGYA